MAWSHDYLGKTVKVQNVQAVYYSSIDQYAPCKIADGNEFWARISFDYQHEWPENLDFTIAIRIHVAGNRIYSFRHSFVLVPVWGFWGYCSRTTNKAVFHSYGLEPGRTIDADKEIYVGSRNLPCCEEDLIGRDGDADVYVIWRASVNNITVVSDKLYHQ